MLALLIVHANCIFSAPSPVASLALLYFSTLSHKRYNFREKNIKRCFDFLYNFYVKHFSFSAECSETLSQMYICLHVKYPFFLSYFSETWNFFTDFRKILKYEILYAVSLSNVNKLTPYTSQDTLYAVLPTAPHVPSLLSFHLTVLWSIRC